MKSSIALMCLAASLVSAIPTNMEEKRDASPEYEVGLASNLRRRSTVAADGAATVSTNTDGTGINVALNLGSILSGLNLGASGSASGSGGINLKERGTGVSVGGSGSGSVGVGSGGVTVGGQGSTTGSVGGTSASAGTGLTISLNLGNLLNGLNLGSTGGINLKARDGTMSTEDPVLESRPGSGSGSGSGSQPITTSTNTGTGVNVAVDLASILNANAGATVGTGSGGILMARDPVSVGTSGSGSVGVGSSGVTVNGQSSATGSVGGTSASAGTGLTITLNLGNLLSGSGIAGINL